MADIRTLGPGLAQVVEDLELEQPVIVTLDDLNGILHRRCLRTPAVEVARRLRDRGWLLQTAQRGVFEFAPGAHAGPYGHGDPFVDLRAYLANQATDDTDGAPASRAAACLHSALWLHGYSDRAPNRHELALLPGTRAPKALSGTFRVVRFDAQLPSLDIKDVPTQRPATVLAHLASRPSDVRSWLAFTEAMPELVAATTADELGTEMRNRAASTRARLGYLIEGQDTSHLPLADLGIVRPPGTIWFGPRGSGAHYDARWNIADTVLRRSK